MSFHVVPRDCRLPELASSIGAKPRDLWLPLRAFASSRSRITTPIRISDSTPIVLHHKESGNLTCNRREILFHLNFFNINNVGGLSLAPSDIPERYELFVRWDKPAGNKLISSNTTVLHRAIPESMTIAEGSAISSGSARVASSKRTRSSTHETIDQSSLTQILDGGSERSSLRVRAADDLDRRLQKVLQERGHDGGQSHAIMRYVRDKITQQHAHSPPLHLLLAAANSSGDSKGALSRARDHASRSIQTADGLVWWRPDPRILYRVFRSHASTERAETSQHGDASRQLAIFFIDDVVLPARLRARKVLEPTIRQRAREDADAAPTTEDSSSPQEDLRVEAHLSAVAQKIKAYADRGYRVLLLDHYPYLHHGNATHLELTLRPISDFWSKYLSVRDGAEGGCTITVILSVMSYITAHQGSSHTAASFVIPNTGIMSYFVANLNTSLQPDTTTSLVVGCSNRSSPLLNGFHKEFADALSLNYVDVASLLSD
ncbi:unnamed protein product [Phytomonas sp. EM1]|nr:unnamed protein product [Phytomonas sp. EM1]|eukprot:CCW61282.1 unnamed protein product [Phytomonas sp. isolate EM1]